MFRPNSSGIYSLKNIFFNIIIVRNASLDTGCWPPKIHAKPHVHRKDMKKPPAMSTNAHYVSITVKLVQPKPPV